MLTLVEQHEQMPIARLEAGKLRTSGVPQLQILLPENRVDRRTAQRWHRIDRSTELFERADGAQGLERLTNLQIVHASRALGHRYPPIVRGPTTSRTRRAGRARKGDPP